LVAEGLPFRPARFVGAGWGVSNYYSIQNGRLASEHIEDEVIVVDFPTGAYFSLRETSAEIWQALVAGASRSKITDDYSQAFPGARDEVAKTVGEFLNLLVAEGLIVAVDSPVSGGETSSFSIAQAMAFRAPVLEKFHDMAELIVLDPIHDVGDLGWPHKPK
jgi:hypothetical protein